MKLFHKLGLLVVIALAVMGVASSSAVAVATYTPAGPFTANGSGLLDPDGAFLPNIVCTLATVTATTDINGHTDGTVTFDSCSAFGAGTCAITPVAITANIDGTGAHGVLTTDTYTLDVSLATTIVCDSIVNCTAGVTAPGTAATNAGGTAKDGDDPVLTLAGTVKDATGGVCTGTMTGVATVDDSPTDAVGGTTGNEISIAA